MFVAIWAWLVTRVFKRRRIIIYLSNGVVIRTVRDRSASPSMAYDQWREWLRFRTDQPTMKIENVYKRGGGRYIILRRDEVSAVDIR